MTTVTINLKASQVYAYLQDVPKSVRAAAQAAINGMNPDVKDFATKEITAVYNINGKAVRKAVRQYARAKPSNLRGIWRAEGRSIPLAQFNVRAMGSGPGAHPVSVEVFRNQRKTIAGGFLGPGAAPAKRLGSSRTPTRRLWGPGIPRMFVQEAVTKAMVNSSERLLPRRMESEMVRQLRKLQTGRLPPLK